MKKLAILFLLLFVISFAETQETLGKVDFPATGKAGAQPYFSKGLSLLHSFEYGDALEAFEKAIEIDPQFVMAYWGAAMTHNHPIWMEQNQEAARAILNRLASSREERQKKGPTEREKAWLSTVEVLYGQGTKEERDFQYERAMENLARAYPQDLETSIFHALSILGTAHNGRDFRIYMKAAGILEEAYLDSPNHPGVLHYMIHCYDDPVHASLGLRAARKYAQIAPAAAHAQHMPSHIFLALGMWPDVTARNAVAFDVADSRVQQKKLGLDERGYHYLHWLEYSYLQQGLFPEARKALSIMNIDAQKSGSARAISHLIRMRAGYILESEEWHGDAVAMEADLSKAKLTGVAIHLFTNGYVAVKKGDLPAAKRNLIDLQERIKSAGTVTSDSHHMTPGSKSYDLDEKTVEILADELNASILFAGGKKVEAIELMKKTSTQEAGLTFEFGPPDIVKPSPELLGEMLLESKKPKEAMDHFQIALERAPGRLHALQRLIRAASESGNKEVEAQARDQWNEIKKNAEEVRKLARGKS